MTKIIDPRYPNRDWNCHSDGMKMLMGLEPKQKWPAEGINFKVVQGVGIYVLSLNEAKAFKVFHRVRAICPKCGKHMSAGRLFQHKC